MDPSDTPPADTVLALTGPTAVGKTARSLTLAERLGAEIVSADSRQVYRPLTVGTAKPSPEELTRVPHHFINERDLGEPFSAGIFMREAAARIEDIRTRGRRALVVGGSTLYLHALQHGLADIPPVEDAVRERLMERLSAEGADTLYAELEEIDPAYAATLDATKTHRLVRGLEVYHGTGRPLSRYHEEQTPSPFDFVTVVLHRDRKQLYARINRRVDQMLEKGLLGEVRALSDDVLHQKAPPLRTIGYREVISHFGGEYDHEEMTRLIKRNTRRYAKRQLTWFRRYDDYRWLDAEAPIDVLLETLGVPSQFDP